MKYRCLIWVLCTHVSFICAEQEVASGVDALTLAEAVSATLAQNPQLTGYQFRTRKLEAQQEIAALKPAYRLSVDVENVAGSGDYAGVDGSEMTLALSSLIEPKGVRDARLGVASARQQQWLSEQRVATLAVLSELARAFIVLAAAQESAELRKRELEMAQAAVVSIKHQVNSARTHEAELLRAEAALAQAEIENLHAGHQLKSQRMQLSLFWADATPDFKKVNADLYTLAPAGDLEKMLEQLDNNPDFALLAQTVELRSAELQKAQMAGKAGFEWRAGVRRFEETDDAALVLGVSMPIGSVGRANSRVASARAEQQGAEYQHTVAKQQARAQLESLHEIYKETLQEANFFQDEVIGKLEKALKAVQQGFDRGRYGYFELRSAQADLQTAREQLLEVVTRAHLLRVDIERLTVVPLSASASVSGAVTTHQELK